MIGEEGGRGDAHDRPRSLPRQLALAMALLVASPPARASASPLPPETRERLEALYTAGAEALEEGDLEAAARDYAEVLKILPEEEGTHGGRAVAMSDAVAAYRAAFDASSEDRLLCAAIVLTQSYERELEERYGSASAEMDGGELAAKLSAELAAIVVADDVLCDEEPEPAVDTHEPEPEPESEPEPEPNNVESGALAPSPLVIGGGIGLGLGAVLLGVMAGGLAVGAGASRDAAALREDMPGLTVDEPAFDELLRRGVRGDRVAWTAGISASIALVGGATLLGLSLRAKRRPSPSARVRPSLGGLVIRF